MSRRTNPVMDRAAQNQLTIKGLLKLEGNKSCADCKRNKHPRWASWNLGIFVCIRCSGIHRGMGTHISRVKSVDLDAWTDEQLQSVLNWGNARANKYWEAKLAPGHMPSEAKIENFIRTKYESKRWVMEGPMPDPSTLSAEGDDDVPLNIVQEKARLDRSSSQRTSSAPSQPPPQARKPTQQSFDLMGGDDLPIPPARPSTTDTPNVRPTPPKSSTPSQLLGGLDFFGGPPERPASAAPQTVGSTGMSRPDLKQSILSLYATAPKPQPQPQSPTQSQPPQQHGRQASFGGMQTAGSSSAFGGLDDAFSGLSFGNSTSSTTSQSQSQYHQPKPSAFASFGQISNQKSTPAAPQATSIPLSGGTFFDTGPRLPPKPAAPRTTAPPALAPRKISNASSGFGEFSSALNPMSGASTATSSNGLISSNGLLDLSPPPMIQSARPANPPKQMSSVFNLTKPAAAPSNYAPVVQSSAPPTKSTFTGISNSDPWGSNDPWANSETAVATPQAQSIKSPASHATSATQSNFGWGDTAAASSGFATNNGGGFGMQSPPGGGGGFNMQSPAGASGGFGASTHSFGASTSTFGASATGPPKIAAEEDFGGWNTAAPETPASLIPPPLSAPRRESQSQARHQQTFNANPSEDLFSNVWG